MSFLPDTLQLKAHGEGAAFAVLRARAGAVRDGSFPELRNTAVDLRSFESTSDYFRTRFSVSRFLFFRRMHYFVDVNPRLFTADVPQEAVCGILAHEFVHITRLSRGNRLKLFGLVRLASRKYTARFERSADFEAIRRGYGPRLIAYRQWLYKNIPARAVVQKRRNYLSPEEIQAVLEFSRADPQLFAYWKHHVPLNLQEIRSSVAAAH